MSSGDCVDGDDEVSGAHGRGQIDCDQGGAAADHQLHHGPHQGVRNSCQIFKIYSGNSGFLELLKLYHLQFFLYQQVGRDGSARTVPRNCPCQIRRKRKI